MSVLLETSLGDLVIDLHTTSAPLSCTNFLKLCSSHYYKLNAFFSVTKDFTAQTGDPTNTGKGGSCVWSQLPSSSRDRVEDTFFRPEISKDADKEELNHARKGTVSFACVRKEGGELVAGSQFFITLSDNVEYLDGRHAPFGVVVEGQEPGGTLDKINSSFVDDKKRPLKDIRIRHVVVLEDPFPDPDGFQAPSRSPSPTPSQVRALRLADSDLESSPPPADDPDARRAADSSAAALTLEMVGDLPFAEVRPPENILFVCKLNPVTRGEDLELIFSRFGKIMSCEVVKDKKTGDSLQYAFVEYDRKQDAERAYFKMQNVLVDDRRIWVDFSQSVGKLHGEWVRKRTGGRGPTKAQYGNSEGPRGQVDSYRPRDGRGINGRHDRAYGGSRNGRDRREVSGSNRQDDSRDRARDGSRERANKRSRRDDGRAPISQRDGEGGYDSHRDRVDADRSRRRHDDEGRSQKRHDEDRRDRDRSPRRHDTSRSERRDRERRDHDRDRHHDRDRDSHRRREDDRDRRRDGSRR